MESNKKLDYDSDVIICENIPETIIVPSSPDKKKKAKTKKHKRKVKRGVNYNNNMETLLITQNFQGKKTKFKCVININTINTVCGKRKCDSIVRYEKNLCKKEAYYDRILPICTRNTCLIDKNVFSSCCRTTESQKHKKAVKAKTRSLSPVSSVTLSEVFECDISYEDVSNGNFSSDSDEELEPLIKRTKLRENKFGRTYSAPEYTSTPISKFQDISRVSSPFSVDNKSIHSDTTLVLKPLSSEAYSPTASLDYIKLENFEYLERSTLKYNESDIPYSPTMTPDLIKAESTSIVTAKTHDEDDIPYSPTFIPESMKTHNENDIPYSPTFTPESMKTHDEDDIPYSPTFTPESMKLENIDYDSIKRHHNINGDMRAPYSLNFTPELIDNKKCDVTPGGVNNAPYSPNLTSDLVKRRKTSNICPSNLIYVKMSDNHTTKMKHTNGTNATRSSVKTSNHIKVETIDNESKIMENNNSTMVKRENVQNPINYNAPDFSAIDNKIHIKNERNYDHKCEIHVKTEKD